MRLVALVALLVGCASSRPAGQPCDPAAGTCPDAPLADASVDEPPKNGFGEPCTDRAQCESNLCVLVGSNGSCTMFCDGGDCPRGWGCVGVNGIDIDGTLSFVCVPETTQLCTTCVQDTECAQIGMDKCVTFEDGDKYCARDCETIGCPVGYECQTVDVGGSNFQQCIPTSGACDCTAANPGDTQQCNINTPFSVCLGTQTCAGDAGWGTCDPPSQIDDPDPNFVDSNCDGIDGDMAKSIFVSGAGANTATCGLVFNDPCQTLAFGIARAGQTARPHVLVQSGTYPGPLTMVNGISVFGGYNVNWQRDSHTVAGHIVTISGGNPAVTFNNITAATMLDNVIVLGSNATGTGVSAMGVLVSGSQQITLRGLLVDPGNGTAGSDGGTGSIGTAGPNGGPGNPGCENSTGFCSTCSRPLGGAFSTQFCGGVARFGGEGGQPGRGDDITPTAGVNGDGGTPGGAAATCHSSRACDGQPGTAGANGATGTAGTGGGSMGSFGNTTYFVANGLNGSLGGHGAGGGGGGGGGGGTNACDSYGSSGGGGGAGGCGGGGGTRGTGGGGSFGVWAFDSMVVIESSTINGRTGGAGGRGGAGGTGGNGGAGGAGGPYGGSSEQDDGGDGAAGGAGGKGGNGGGGGGGGGGPSIAVVCRGTSTTLASAVASTLTGGTGGVGGTGGNPGATGASAAFFGCPF